METNGARLFLWLKEEYCNDGLSVNWGIKSIRNMESDRLYRISSRRRALYSGYFLKAIIIV